MLRMARALLSFIKAPAQGYVEELPPRRLCRRVHPMTRCRNRAESKSGIRHWLKKLDANSPVHSEAVNKQLIETQNTFDEKEVEQGLRESLHRYSFSAAQT